LGVCPASPPSGACTVEYLSCAYPTQSCLCDGGAWKCFACPAKRPDLDAEFNVATVDRRLSFACVYCGLTCTFPTLRASQKSDSWTCGVCPASRPEPGAACGNTQYQCRYGQDTCQCHGDGWSCVTPTCDLGPNRNLQCLNEAVYTCTYADLDQNCVCGTRGNGRRCSCPTTAPTDGSTCVGFAGPEGGGSECKYGDLVCSCGSTLTTDVWACRRPPADCPTAKPTPGTACTGQVTCNYSGALCACDGATWTCF
jgi:hypothetical protein